MDWKKLTIESRDIIQEFLQNKFETSDMNFTNIFLWSFSEDIQYVVNDEVLYIRGFYEGNEYYFLPVSKENNKEKIVEAVRKIKENNGKIVFIPEEYVELLKEYFLIQEERDSFDYIYLQKDLAELKGRKFSSKKNKINKFKKEYNFTYEKISKENIEDIRIFQREWTENRKDDNIILSETLGIEQLLNNYEKLELRGGVIKVDEKIVSYAIGEKLSDSMGVIHIEKGLFDYQGSYQMINMYVAKEEFSDVEFMNREDDFGSLGLREAKLSYQPIKFIKKYSI
ncbi:DUF2156 domain-containing protein [Candidatus Cetobacterium colombiensis]|jgi:hypothetical protein|uniref:Phosphatidylglycerol lysyltransferase domain-containing protein n=1 Tax=Candidatus Cetobacterium colombiensis TaxID=3073100 RepID=A0ABU4WAF2_9FUSO|nr:phosphatidylglycerol lysyltransferase domain-containing protein [Candidatus Cetobacterium colombiensis]MDX8335556.1 phosphatidylglycerol lysyltransferase domain-containing protein [Candidatus Cetobacterium colombiensis]